MYNDRDSATFIRERNMPDNDVEKTMSPEERVMLGAGWVILLEKEEFIDILKRQDKPLVVCSLKGTFRNVYTYLTTYRGLLFAHKAKRPVPLEGYELINAEEIRFCGRRLR
jgi:hypothetical protein